MRLLEIRLRIFQALTLSPPLLLLQRQLLLRRLQRALGQGQLLGHPLFLQPFFGQGLLMLKSGLLALFVPSGRLLRPLALLFFQLLRPRERRLRARPGHPQGGLEINDLFKRFTESLVLRQKLPGIPTLRVAQTLHLLGQCLPLLAGFLQARAGLQQGILGNVTLLFRCLQARLDAVDERMLVPLQALDLLAQGVTLLLELRKSAAEVIQRILDAR